MMHGQLWLSEYDELHAKRHCDGRRVILVLGEIEVIVPAIHARQLLDELLAIHEPKPVSEVSP